jgi:tetratricopeptide (TPR) repeat protein
MAPKLSPRSLLHAVAAAFLLLALAAVASAKAYPPCDRKPSPADIEGAKGAHKAAETHYNKGRYDRAIAAWEDAYNFDCTAHRLLINIGNAYEKLGQRQNAIEAFETYLDRAGDNADPTIADKVANLKALQSQDQNPPPPPPTATATGTDTGTGPPPPPPDTAADPGPGPWILVGAGAALTIAGVVMLAVGIDKINEADDECPNRKNCDPEIADLGNEGRTLQGIGIAGAAVGVAAVGAGLLWYFLTGDDSPAPATARAVTVQPLVSPWTAGVSVSAAF